MPVVASNNATGVLAQAPGTGGTSIVLQAGQGAVFPSPAAGQWAPGTLYNASGTTEIVKITGRSGDTLTVVRAQEGTAAYAFQVGDKIDCRITAATLANKLDVDGGTVTGSVTFNQPINGSITGSSASCTGQAATAAAVSGSAVTTGLGYTPANRAGDTFTGAVVFGDPISCGTQDGFNYGIQIRANPTSGSPTFGVGILQFVDSTSDYQWSTLSCAGNGLPLLMSGKAVARVNQGNTANSGLITWGAGAPGSLDVGEIYLQTS